MSAIKELLENVILESEDLPNLQELALKAQVELTQMIDIKNEAQSRLVALGQTMPCGHLARYAVNGEDGTQYCCMCETIKLAEKFTDNDNDKECPYCSKTDWGWEKHDQHCVFSFAYKFTHRGAQ